MSWWSGASTDNIIDNAVSSMTSVGNSAQQACAPAAAQSIALSLKSCGDLTISGNDFTQKQIMNVKCSQDATQEAKSQTNIDQKTDQLATSLTAALAITPGSAEATNIAKMSTAVGSVVKNVVEQAVTSATNSTIHIDGSTCPTNANFVSGGSHNLSFRDNLITQISTTSTDLVQKSTQVASAVNDLKQYVKQIADAKRPGIFGDFGPIVGVVVAVIALAFAAKMMRARSGLVHGGGLTPLMKTVLSLAALAAAIFAIKKSETATTAAPTVPVSKFCSAAM